jgi:hypothetical protein
MRYKHDYYFINYKIAILTCSAHVSKWYGSQVVWVSSGMGLKWYGSQVVRV